MKGYLSIRETSYKWGVSERRVNQYVTEGRIPGVERFGRSWAIPDTAKKPEDPRKEKKNACGFYGKLWSGFSSDMSAVSYDEDGLGSSCA